MGLLNEYLAQVELPDMGEFKRDAPRLTGGMYVNSIPNGYAYGGKYGYQFSPELQAWLSANGYKSGKQQDFAVDGIGANLKQGQNTFGLGLNPQSWMLNYNRALKDGSFDANVTPDSLYMQYNRSW